jgi:cation diffusion facilitator CzcD-associated flavoprotein CzcO
MEAHQKKGPKVAVIGCGPGGMFFLHALATKRRKLEEACDVEGLAAFPQVTVYEKASDPGGVWRPNTESKTPGSINMFGGLWSNSPSMETEFFDNTFKDHFSGSVPLYLPRGLLLEYMMDRVTSVEDIFQHVQFNTQVTWAFYNEDMPKFVVETKNLDTEKDDVAEFDKLVWAGGVLSELYYPKGTHSRLISGGFKGQIKHSADVVDIDSSIEGKQMVMVGDSFSAEDLTLQALKMNAKHVYITSANGQGLAPSTSTWPGNKAESLECLPTEVINNGTGLLCSEVEYDEDIGNSCLWREVNHESLKISRQCFTVQDMVQTCGVSFLTGATFSGYYTPTMRSCSE